MEASKESCSFIFFSVPPSWRQTNSPLLAHFISFRGYGTDWVSTVVAIEAYGSKATVEENLRGRRCNRKDQNNSAGLTRGTIQFVMWNHGLSVAQWERVPGETAQQSACEWPRGRSLTGFFLLFFGFFSSLATLATINLLSRHDYTGAPVGTINQKWCAVSRDDLAPCDVTVDLGNHYCRLLLRFLFYGDWQLKNVRLCFVAVEDCLRISLKCF